MERNKKIIQTSIIGIIANVILVAFKAIIGLASNSIAIIMDAVNNLSDALSSIITIVGTKLAGKQPDKKHPYGYGRIEYISSVIIAIMILIAGGTSAKESIDKIIHPVAAEYSIISIVIITVAIVTKFVLGRYVKSVGEKCSSQSLVASGQDAFFDSIISLSTLVAAIISMIFHISIEGYLGVVISIVILKAGVDVLLESLSGIIGERVESDLAMEVKKFIRGFDNVNGAYDLVLHKYGPEKLIGSVHVEIPDELSAGDIHILTRRIIEDTHKEFGIVLTVGIYASNKTDPLSVEIQDKVNTIIRDYPDVLQMHGFYLDRERKHITFDVVINFKCPDKFGTKDEIIKRISEEYPEYLFEASIDTDFSD